mgnify:FL=1
MGKKEKCKEIMGRLLGEAAASQVDDMSEDDCVPKCKEQIKNFLGETTAESEFAGL